MTTISTCVFVYMEKVTQLLFSLQEESETASFIKFYCKLNDRNECEGHSLVTFPICIT